jgi:hypothetical protein
MSAPAKQDTDASQGRGGSGDLDSGGGVLGDVDEKAARAAHVLALADRDQRGWRHQGPGRGGRHRRRRPRRRWRGPRRPRRAGRGHGRETPRRSRATPGARWSSRGVPSGHRGRPCRSRDWRAVRGSRRRGPGGRCRRWRFSGGAPDPVRCGPGGARRAPCRDRPRPRHEPPGRRWTQGCTGLYGKRDSAQSARTPWMGCIRTIRQPQGGTRAMSMTRTKRKLTTLSAIWCAA